MLRVRTASTISSPRPSSSPQHSAGAASRACAMIVSNAAFLILNSNFQILDGHGDSHAATNTERRDAVLFPARPRRIDERRQHASAIAPPLTLTLAGSRP